MEKRLDDIRTYVQRLAAVLEPEETLLLDQNQVTLRAADQEVSEDIFIPERKTLAERIRESMFIYLQDLNRGNPKELILPLEIPGEDWKEKLTHYCQEIIDLNPRLKTNGQFLEAYYQLGSLMDEKEWSEAAKKKLRLHFSTGKGKIVTKMSKRAYQLFNARGEWYMYMLEHINISILEKMYEEYFTYLLLTEAQNRRSDEMSFP
ncbi:hypothetical protein C2G38_2049640 [Gigaspora rosea]|uniref:Uncharacterized protein n=1 Tax=Gigaspora rosea TaxID=44941 RepID=A0A397TZZ6_9GLOM|nr:hypothetical protein C2G38_2049640 [Gigaspora rosea]